MISLFSPETVVIKVIHRDQSLPHGGLLSLWLLFTPGGADEQGESPSASMKPSVNHFYCLR